VVTETAFAASRPAHRIFDQRFPNVSSGKAFLA
jgi:hypothetical protein